MSASIAPAQQARAQRVLPALLATFMSLFVAGLVTALNTGVDAGLPLRWLSAWLVAWPAAVVAAYLFRPLAWWLSLRIADRMFARGSRTRRTETTR